MNIPFKFHPACSSCSRAIVVTRSVRTNKRISRRTRRTDGQPKNIMPSPTSHRVGITKNSYIQTPYIHSRKHFNQWHLRFLSPAIYCIVNIQVTPFPDLLGNKCSQQVFKRAAFTENNAKNLMQQPEARQGSQQKYHFITVLLCSGDNNDGKVVIY